MAEPETPDKPPFQQYYIDPQGVLMRIDADGSIHEVPLAVQPLHGAPPEDLDDRDEEG